ncbi:MAG: efflux RND transporter periplasmic adaptor subunit [Hyphomicrobium sp.]
MKWIATLVVAATLAAGGYWWARPDAARQLLGLTPTTSAGPDAAANPSRSGRGGPAAATTVEIATARQARTTTDIRAVGSLQSDETVEIAPEIAGRITEIVFAEGRSVKAGDAIVKLDDSLAKAELAQAKSRLSLASANNDRARVLSRSGNVTERVRDESKSTYDVAVADVELSEARLAKHVLTAPFDGIAGVRSVSVGAYVSAGTKIVNIEKIDSLKVDFKVPELFLQSIKVDQQIEVHVDAVPGRVFQGRVYAINPLVDVNGRALQIRAVLPNADLALRPGLFARILIKGLVERDVILVPESAILPRGGESFVFRVENGKAVERQVQLGERKNGEVEIVQGLEAQATIVVAGQQKLRNGAEVEVVPAAQNVPQNILQNIPKTSPKTGAPKSGASLPATGGSG